MKDRFSLSFHSSLFLFIHFFFDSLFFFWFIFQHFCFVLAHFHFPWGELNISWNSNFSDLPSSIRRLVAYSLLENIFFRLCALVWRMILGQDIEGNYQAQRGDYRIIFYISEGMVKDGHFSFQTQLPKLKSKSLQENEWFVFL